MNGSGKEITPKKIRITIHYLSYKKIHYKFNVDFYTLVLKEEERKEKITQKNNNAIVLSPTPTCYKDR